jgi:hypothetical protein
MSPEYDNAENASPSMLKSKQNKRTISFFDSVVLSIFNRQAKRKRALLESNLPGITCPTGMVKGAEFSALFSFQEFIPSKTQKCLFNQPSISGRSMRRISAL